MTNHVEIDGRRYEVLAHLAEVKASLARCKREEPLYYAAPNYEHELFATTVDIAVLVAALEQAQQAQQELALWRNTAQRLLNEPVFKALNRLLEVPT